MLSDAWPAIAIGWFGIGIALAIVAVYLWGHDDEEDAFAALGIILAWPVALALVPVLLLAHLPVWIARKFRAN